MVPWGRLAWEYEAMFALEGLPTATRVLDVGGGPASFTAEWTARGRPVAAVDPLYAFPGDPIAKRFEATRQAMLNGMEAARDRFVWDRYASPDDVLKARRRALVGFLGDYEAGCVQGRYTAGSLPELPIDADAADLVLCSHLLFLYADDLDLDFHLAALEEMLRVGTEVRVFPLRDLDGEPSRHLAPVRAHFGARSEVVDVDFEFQRAARQHLRVTR